MATTIFSRAPTEPMSRGSPGTVYNVDNKKRCSLSRKELFRMSPDRCSSVSITPETKTIGNSEACQSKAADHSASNSEQRYRETFKSPQSQTRHRLKDFRTTDTTGIDEQSGDVHLNGPNGADKSDKVFRRFLENVANVKLQIQMKCEEEIHYIRRCTETLLQELVSFEESGFDEFEIYKEEAGRQSIVVETFRTYSQELLKSTPGGDLFRSVAHLQAMSTEIEDMVDGDLMMPRVSFIPLDIEDMLEKKQMNIIGAIAVSSGSQH